MMFLQGEKKITTQFHKTSDRGSAPARQSVCARPHPSLFTLIRVHTPPLSPPSLCVCVSKQLIYVQGPPPTPSQAHILAFIGIKYHPANYPNPISTHTHTQTYVLVPLQQKIEPCFRSYIHIYTSDYTQKQLVTPCHPEKKRIECFVFNSRPCNLYLFP